MKLRVLAIHTVVPAGLATLLTTIGIAIPLRAENLSHTQQLLSTRKCSRCDLSSAGLTFANLSNADLTQANLSGANLSRANLQGADLRGANLIGASLFGANLTGAKLDGANLGAADLRGAYLTGASITGVVWESTLLEEAVGLPNSVGKVEDFYNWAMEDMRRKNFPGAIDNFNQVLNRKPDFAQAYMGRGVARLQTDDREGGIEDVRRAETLFTAQGNQEGTKVAQQMVKDLTTPPPEQKTGGGLGQALIGVLGFALQFLPFSLF
ncbi:pentapeptide repeat-containing protein [Kovacikia minuta CCNUW1]|uniref:pentapeptide repeat-containing protein n=1 Tax=Kovacikia minuta TaxID=2931930 RepID=UPI001CD03DA6|nr:pentapeptide repeat-containing protein [Kovacikia minuta]UBF25359.1 pentapeptide repeat-containing protein [Kovacikia minuta CCNUW1]